LNAEPLTLLRDILKIFETILEEYYTINAGPIDRKEEWF